MLTRRNLFFSRILTSDIAFSSHMERTPRAYSPNIEVRTMRKLSIAFACLVALSAPAFAQDAGVEAAAKPARVSALKVAISEVAILRYRAALKLSAAQEKYWPAVASALRALAREPQINEAAVRRFAPAASALFANLDDHQKQVAMGLVQKAGLTQYAALF